MVNMCTGKIKIFLLLFINLVFGFDNNALTRTYAMAVSDDVNDLLVELTTFAPLFEEVTENTPMTLNKHRRNLRDLESLFSENNETYKGIHSRIFRQSIKQHENKVLSYDSNDSNLYLNQYATKFHSSITSSTSSPLFKLLSNSMSKEGKWPKYTLEKSLKKRNAADKDDDLTNGMSKKNQRKANTLRRLLLNNVSNKNYEDIQDNYIEDDDDDYFKNLNKKKMNWDDYQNDDGASVMELVALDVRHKKHMREDSQNDYLYW
nr:uncharacterized protein LOC116426172 [Nomia melanderi]